MLRRLVRLVAAVGIACAVPAHALGLGEIDVRSKLNQRFSASIPVLDASAQDLESLQVVLASAADFERSGIERADYLSSLTLKLESGAGGTRVHLSSAQIDREPFLNFLVEARWQGGRLQREYTVLLDPPNLAGGRSGAQAASQPGSATSTVAAPAAEPAAAPAVAPAAEQAPLEPYAESKPALGPTAAPRTAAVGRKAEIDEAATTGATSSKTYGPIDPQETLWSIAAKLKPDAATADQMLLALYQANPGAFDHRRFNGLMRGATLNVPADDQILAVSPEAARARVEKLRRGEKLTADSAVAEPAPRAVPAKKAKAAPTVAAPSGSGAETPAPAAPATVPTAAAPSGHPGSNTTASVLPTGPSAVAPSAAPAPASVLPTGPAVLPATAPGAAAVAASPESPPVSAAAAATEPVVAPPVEPVTAPPPASPEPGAVQGANPASSAVPAGAAQNKVEPAPAAVPPVPAPGVSLVDDFRLPLLAILVVLLVGFFGWRMTREKGPGPSAFPSMPVAPMPTAAKAEPLASVTQISAVPASLPVFDNISKPGPQETGAAPLVTESHAIAVPEPRQPIAPVAAAKPADVDLTSQLQAQTVPANLDANDPLSEANFHLAYGLYDEAATLLRRGLEKEPMRKDLRIKLAETYFGARKAAEFQQTALALRGQIPAADWHKLAEMGRQIAPQVGAFREDDAAAAAPAEPAPIAAAAPGTRLDFTLDELIEPAAPASRPAAADSNVIDFDLDTALSNLAQKPAPVIPAPSAAPEIDLSHFDLAPATSPAAPVKSAAAVTPAAPDEAAGLDFQLEDLDLSRSFPDSNLPASEDEISTKLDLARAYADMGDNEAAGGLLNEVIAAGNGAQKQEAEALAKRLHAA